ncbi:hypothetical protein IU443_21430 [Nocardia farcinica]|uniref:hypothetical protein n=1 Tax=Nocardia farcinica TaxID=37329 RepID=UPI00189571E7|nr:hypothetical protein [Nocardia farcinica]MBF6253124.1 hypothetical protein [Nocardia farcinica]MBF6392508.1 hypothetical protein [Nocardia farcinica]MBF6584953.1 hypothetical protein [Nocardia farcinica]
MAEYEASLPRGRAEELRKDLAARGITGKTAFDKFGQLVISDISHQRQGEFRGVYGGGLPGSRR